MKIFVTSWALALLSLAIVCSAAGAEAPAAGCFEWARQWVEENRDSLPADLDALQRLDAKNQRAVAIFAPPELRARLWRQHLERLLVDDQLTDAQQAALHRIVAKLDPAFFAPENLEASRAVLRSADELTTLFGRDLRQRVFVTLGATDPALASSAAAADEEEDKEERPVCECTFGAGSDFCPGKLLCKEKADKCKLTSGCGILLMEDCDGMCKPPLPLADD